MVATDIPGGRRYSCNDFELDDDFDDLVFTVTRPSDDASAQQNFAADGAVRRR